MSERAPATPEEVRQAQERGTATFLGVRLKVPLGTLVPRRETEVLARGALVALNGVASNNPRVIDMCCGLGNLTAVIARESPATHVWACDLTDACVEATRQNVRDLDLSERVTVLQGDLFEPLRSEQLEGQVDLVVCNPPYISTGRLLTGDRAELLMREPREAFDAGPFGVGMHQRLVRDAAQYLKSGGRLLFEFGIGQARQVRILIERAGAYRDVTFISDSDGQERVASATRI